MNAEKQLKPLDSRPPIGGWAPGDYLALCRQCQCHFVGDKRAWHCADCAYNTPAKSRWIPSEEYLAANAAALTQQPKGGEARTIDECCGEPEGSFAQFVKDHPDIDKYLAEKFLAKEAFEAGKKAAERLVNRFALATPPTPQAKESGEWRVGSPVLKIDAMTIGINILLPDGRSLDIVAVASDHTVHELRQRATQICEAMNFVSGADLSFDASIGFTLLEQNRKRKERDEQHEQETIALRSEISALKKKVEGLERTFRHRHVNNGEDDACKKCGLDLRSSVHSTI